MLYIWQIRIALELNEKKGGEQITQRDYRKSIKAVEHIVKGEK